jgi:phosphoribosylformylglycinamidine cyclo-ligase
MSSPDSAPPRPSGAPLTYRASGVDIDAGSEAVRRIRGLVATTRRPEQLSDLGGFAGLIGMPQGVKDPVLVSCTDGTGTKVLVAIAMGKHDTIGIDLVAMNVNDLLVTGARPLFVLDYIACAKLEPAVVEAIVAGICEGCRQSGAALLGGEMAEHPGMHAPGHYDLAAFAVGVVERAAILGPERVREGDVVLALPSSGLHSNGYSLARRALLDPDYAGLTLREPLPGGTGQSVGAALLEPTIIYERAFAAIRALDGAPLHAAAHITGGGLVENPPRVLPDTMAMTLDLGAVKPAPVFAAIAAQGVAKAEMLRTFNCGIGMLLVVERERERDVTEALAAAGQPCLRVGAVGARAGHDQVHLANAPVGTSTPV